MDYSLLVGIHDCLKGNTTNIRDSVLSFIEPSQQDISMHQNATRRSTLKSPLPFVGSVTGVSIGAAGGGGSGGIGVGSKRKPTLIDSDSIKAITTGNIKMPFDNPPERSFCVFYKDCGGFLATDENNESLPILYFLGIIDIFTEYTAVKKVEHFFKSITHNGHKISAVKPEEYGQRFLKFMKAATTSSYQQPVE
ncbi:Phosphatidylinositol-4-phosphate 5-kinase [Physocladia obscura]|uniref:Phosphatidylinositol-4-phosphate 5-kinase n=1 Tax=Physocladia obscura TaxID=109957 RepID=A0AAD5XC02_9FUNG|nr:Phosphatidylinositol-4-phosphate 5-kinase [Physocladia obscura]